MASLRTVPAIAIATCRREAWYRNSTYPRHLVVLGRLRVRRWRCKACLGSASAPAAGVTARQGPQSFRELVTDLYVHSVSFRSLSCILALLQTELAC